MNSNKNISTLSSIRTQISIIFAVLLLGMILLCLFVNNIFLEKYYLNNKCKTLEDTYIYLDDLYSEEVVDSNGRINNTAFEYLCDSNNVDIIIVNSSLEIVESSMHNNANAMRRLFSFIFKDNPNYLFDENNKEINDNNEINDKDAAIEYGENGVSENRKKNFQKHSEKLFKKNDDYVIMSSNDPMMNADFIELMGSFSNGNLVIIRTSVDSITDSAQLANKFLLYVGTSVAIIGVLLIYLITRRITRPILELADISDKMAQLDFNARYSGEQRNEIGYLGIRMNELSQTLEKTISELKNANNELKVDLQKRQQLDEMRSDFISNVSHELKTPLSIIQGYAEGLKDCVNDDPESREYYSEVIIDESTKMNRMIQDMLELNQLEFGNDIVKMERFNLSELLKDFCESVSILVEQASVTFEINISDDLYVYGDKYRIEEVVSNYFSNAIHYVNQGGVIRIMAARRDNIVRCTVFNSGSNISDANSNKIWDKFFKIDKARTRMYGGSGVGLSIVKAIMEAHHSAYGMENLPEGVQFWFELDCK